MTDLLWLFSDSCFEHVSEHNSLESFTLALPEATKSLWTLADYIKISLFCPYEFLLGRHVCN